MTATTQLLRLWMAEKRLETQTDAARVLGVKPSAVNNWVQGVSQAAPHLVKVMADGIGQNPAHWMMLVESERSKASEDRAAWTAALAGLGRAAMHIMSTVRRALTHRPRPNDQAGPPH